MSGPPIVVIILMCLVGAVVIGVLIGGGIIVVQKLAQAIGFILGRTFRFAAGEIGDALRIVGDLLTIVVYTFLTLGNIVVGRWSAAGHFGRAIVAEFRAIGTAGYRMVIGHPARLFGATGLVEGIENRVPEVMHAAPGADRPSRKTGQFAGYRVVGSLPGGGSGGKLYIAEPDEIKLAGFARSGITGVERVVIKAFSLKEGSSLPQIVRENQALSAAKRLGLVLEHDLSGERFYYVMRYVPGDPLSLVTQRLHASSGSGGLARREMADAVRYAMDLLTTLEEYHRAGLWHKDVKPDNIIVHDARAHLVDFGLITPLASSLTLTTHGTEYFRDPEMVRLALKGVKVHEVDGVKFDVYAAGAVLYSLLENSFPAHGGLSQITKNTPEALRWVVRRAMADYDKRYASAAEMLADVRVLAAASDPFTVRPADLPSVAGQPASFEPGPGAAPAPQPSPAWAASPAAGSPVPPPRGAVGAGQPDGQREAAHAAAGEPAQRPNARWRGQVGPFFAEYEGPPSPVRRINLRVTNWWTGQYQPNDKHSPRRPDPAADPAFAGMGGAAIPGAPRGAHRAAAQAVKDAVAHAQAEGEMPFVRPAPRPGAPRAAAAEQVRRARERAASARARAQARISGRRSGAPKQKDIGLNAGVAAALAIGVLVIGGPAAFLITQSKRSVVTTASDTAATPAPVPPAVPDLPALPSEAVTIPATSEADYFPETARRDARAMMVRDAIAGRDAQRLIVLRDPMPNVPEADRIELSDSVEALRLGGLTVTDEQTVDVLALEDMEALARLRGAIGVAPIGSAEAKDAIERFLAGSREYAGVVWLAPGAESASQAAGLVILANAEQSWLRDAVERAFGAPLR